MIIWQIYVANLVCFCLRIDKNSSESPLSAVCMSAELDVYSLSQSSIECSKWTCIIEYPLSIYHLKKSGFFFSQLWLSNQRNSKYDCGLVYWARVFSRLSVIWICCWFCESNANFMTFTILLWDPKPLKICEAIFIIKKKQ